MTPGPYKVFGFSIKALSHGRWFTIATVGNRMMTAEGNTELAHLLAAAPDMAEALRAIVKNAVKVSYGFAPDTLRQAEMDWEFIEKAQAALAKAGGS